MTTLPAPTISTTAELRALLRLAGPVVVSQFAANALALIATAVIGRLGERELAAAAYANAAYYLVFIMVVGVMLSVAPRVAQAHGAGDARGVARALGGGLRLALLLSAVMLPLMWALSFVLPNFAPAGVSRDLVAAYLRVYSLGMLPNLAFIALRGTLEGTGKPGAVTGVALTGVVWALLVAPALAFGWGRCPGWDWRARRARVRRRRGSWPRCCGRLPGVGWPTRGRSGRWATRFVPSFASAGPSA
ncbi:MATE family efflux transporter [Deinococcus radiodurans]|nr:MATE family efflux transporter [Deinococcus radiodurans]